MMSYQSVPNTTRVNIRPGTFPPHILGRGNGVAGTLGFVPPNVMAALMIAAAQKRKAELAAQQAQQSASTSTAVSYTEPASQPPVETAPPAEAVSYTNIVSPTTPAPTAADAVSYTNIVSPSADPATSPGGTFYSYTQPLAVPSGPSVVSSEPTYTEEARISVAEQPVVAKKTNPLLIFAGLAAAAAGAWYMTK
jgi:hypothetical protein